MITKYKYIDIFVYPLIFLSFWGVFALADQYFVGAQFNFHVEDNEYGWFGVGLNWMSMHPMLWQHHPSPSFNQISGLLVWFTNLDGTDKAIHQFITLVNVLQAVLVITAGLWFAWVSNVISLSHPQKLLLVVLVFLFPTLVYHTVHWSIYYLIPLFGLPMGLTIFGFLQGQRQLTRTCGLGLGFLSANYYPFLPLLGLVILSARFGNSHADERYYKSLVKRANRKRNISIIVLWCCLCAFLVGIYFSGIPILNNVDNFRPISKPSVDSNLIGSILVGVLFALAGSWFVVRIAQARPDIGQFIFWVLIAFVLSNGVLLPWYLHGIEVVYQERTTGIIASITRLLTTPKLYPWLFVPLFSMASFVLVIILNRVSKGGNFLKSKESLYGLILALLGTGIIAIVATPELRPGMFPGKAERLFIAAVPSLVVGWVILFKSLHGLWRYAWQITLFVLAVFSFVHFYETYWMEVKSNRMEGQAIDKAIDGFFEDHPDGRVICVGDEFSSRFCTTAYAYNRYRTDASADALPMKRLFNGQVISLNGRPDEVGNWVDSDKLINDLVFDRFAPKLVITLGGSFQQQFIAMFFLRGYDVKPIWQWQHKSQNIKDRRLLKEKLDGSFLAGLKISDSDIISRKKYWTYRTNRSHIDYSDQNLWGRQFSGKDLSGANFNRANLVEADFGGAELQYSNFVGAKISEANLSGANLAHAIFYRADLSGANLSEADLTKVNLWNTALNGADLRGVSMVGAILWGADLKNADLSNTNLRNQDFSGANLEGANLQGVDLEGANVQGTRFKGSNLRQANLAGLDLSKKDLSRINLNGANVQGTRFKGSNLRQANLAGLDLSKKDLSRINLNGANVQGTRFKGSNLRQANLAGLDLSKKDLSGANLSGANLEGANVQGTRFKGSNLRQANLAGLDLSKKDLSGANLSGANLEGANVQGTRFKGSNLRQANLAGLDLSKKDLSGANLSGANLEGANLSDSNLQGVNLKGANLEGANVQGTRFKGSNLRQANLAGLDLSKKDLSGANLSGANLEGANLSDSNLQGVNLVNANLNEANLKKALR